MKNSICIRVMRIFCAAVLVAFACFASHGAVHRFTVTLNAGGAAAENVPVALRLSPGLVRGFDYDAAGDGTHFEISDENGSILPYEIDTWNPDGESLLWVEVPFFVKGRKLTVVYGRTNEDMTNAAQVWSNYIGVWHMNAVNAAGKYPNSTGVADFDGEVSSFSKTGESGKFGQSVLIFTNAMHSLNGVPEAKERGGVFIPDGGSLDLMNNFTVSSWFSHATVDNPAIGADGVDQTHDFRFDTLFCKRKHPKANNALNDGSRAGFSLRVNENKTKAGNLVLNGHSDADNEVQLLRSIENGAWHHLALAFDADGRASTWLDGVCVTNHAETIVDNDEPLVIGNTSLAYRNNEGNRAWGGYADEVRLHRGTPSGAYLAAEYAAMANEHEYGVETCSLTIDKNEHFDDSVTISSNVPLAANGEYYVGTTITLTAVPGATGTFRKWYGDVPRESCTNATVSFVIERDAWVYARFVHPWTLAADKTTMTDGNFTVNVSVVSESKHTLCLGKSAEAGLSADGDTGTGTLDLGGPISIAGNGTPWTISEFGRNRGSQVFAKSREGTFRYLSPGTLAASVNQPFHCGDNTNVFGKSYSMIILDEPTESSLINTYCFTAEASLDTVIFDLPNWKSPHGERVLGPAPLGNTRLEWWDFSSAATIAESFFACSWATDDSLRPRSPFAGTIVLPAMRGLDWAPGLGTLLCMMPKLEGISLGGATEETTVTNLCTYAFAGDSSLRKLTLHAAPDMQVGKRIFADKTYNTSNGVEVIDGVTYMTGTQTSRGRVPDVIHFTGQAVSEEAISNLLADVPVVSSAAKPVVIHASRFQDGWKENKRDWISSPTATERAAYPGEKVLGVYRAGAEEPSGKAVILHRGNDWDKGTNPGLFIRLR